MEKRKIIADEIIRMCNYEDICNKGTTLAMILAETIKNFLDCLTEESLKTIIDINRYKNEDKRLLSEVIPARVYFLLSSVLKSSTNNFLCEDMSIIENIGEIVGTSAAKVVNGEFDKK